MPPGEEKGDASRHELPGVTVAERAQQHPVAVPIPFAAALGWEGG